MNSLSERLGWLGRQGGLLHESILISGGMGETAIAEIIEPFWQTCRRQLN